jgi:acetyltransferase-like isoleucine patch superfamily enzyme
MNHQPRSLRSDAALVWRVGCTLVTIVVVEAVVCGLSALPVVVIWSELMPWLTSDPLARTAVFGVLIVPSYVAFALCLMAASAAANRATGARTLPDAAMPISEMGWPLMRWARYMVASHVVRVLAGAIFRGSPIWTAYLRLNGATIGRGAYVNSLFVSDHNLLEFGDHVVIGSEVHLSGHTVEAGVVKTARVRLGRDVTIGLGSVIDIGVTVGDRTQVGALSFVPKHTALEADSVYLGIPVRRIDVAATPTSDETPADPGCARSPSSDTSS